jgi:maleate cis-trans isomerase
MSVVDELERRLDAPVVTSNQAVLWDALVRIGHADVSACPGRLFAVGAAPARRSAVS